MITSIGKRLGVASPEAIAPALESLIGYSFTLQPDLYFGEGFVGGRGFLSFDSRSLRGYGEERKKLSELVKGEFWTGKIHGFNFEEDPTFIFFQGELIGIISKIELLDENSSCFEYLVNGKSLKVKYITEYGVIDDLEGGSIEFQVSKSHLEAQQRWYRMSLAAFGNAFKKIVSV